MKTKVLIAATLVLFMFSLPTFARREGGPRWKEWSKERDRGKKPPCPIIKMFNRMTRPLPEKLDMTEDQLEDFKKICKEHRKKMMKIWKEFLEAREEFRSKLNSILTPEQKEKLNEMKKKARRRIKHAYKERGKRKLPSPAIVARAIRKMDLPDDKVREIKELVAETRERIKIARRTDRESIKPIIKDFLEELKSILSDRELKQLKEITRDLQAEKWKSESEYPPRKRYREERPRRRPRPTPPPVEDDEFWW